MGRGKRTAAPLRTAAERKPELPHGLPLDDIRALEAALAALELEPPTPDAVLVAARVGAFATGRRLLERLQRYELSAPLDQLQAADKQEWWQAEDLLGQARMQITVLAALTGRSGVAQVATDSHSPAYVRHRLAVEGALALALMSREVSPRRVPVPRCGSLALSSAGQPARVPA